METTKACLLKYRHAMRQILAYAGVASNPGVDDDWILDQISLKVTGNRVEWQKCEHCHVNFPGHTSLSMHISSDHPEFANTEWYRK